MSSVQIIKNGKVLTMAGRIIELGYVVITNGKISDVGCGTPECGGQEFDANGGYILPGFIDAHCHIGIFEDGMGFEGDDGNECTDPVTPHLRAIDAINHNDGCFMEARNAGITTVVTGPGSANVLGGRFTALKTYGNSVDSMIIKECAALKAAFGENPKAVYSKEKAAPGTRMATAALLREALFKANEYKDEWHKYSENTRDNDKPSFDIKYDSLLKIINKEVPLKIHAHRADDILTGMRIAKEFDIPYTIEHCTEGHLIADLLAENNVKVIIGPIICDRSKIELRNLTVKAGGILSNAGLEIAIMTDHPCTPIQYLPLCAAIAAREGMDEMAALRAITINAAKFTGIDDRTGSLEIGKDGDVVVYSGHPFDLRSKALRTYIDGMVVANGV